MPVRAVIFDLDGTITKPFFDFDAIRAEMGLDKNAGPVLEAMQKMSPRKRARAERILLLYERRAVTESKLNPGAKKTLQTLQKAGVPIGILTRNKRTNALAVARKHGLSFDAVVDREDGPVKPDAFGVLRICEQFGVRPSQTLVVGDYLFDLLCAKAAGAVAVLLADNTKAAQFEPHADFTIERIDQVLEIINRKARKAVRR